MLMLQLFLLFYRIPFARELYILTHTSIIVYKYKCNFCKTTCCQQLQLKLLLFSCYLFAIYSFYLFQFFFFQKTLAFAQKQRVEINKFIQKKNVYKKDFPFVKALIHFEHFVYLFQYFFILLWHNFFSSSIFFPILLFSTLNKFVFFFLFAKMLLIFYEICFLIFYIFFFRICLIFLFIYFALTLFVLCINFIYFFQQILFYIIFFVLLRLPCSYKVEIFIQKKIYIFCFNIERSLFSGCVTVDLGDVEVKRVFSVR